ncbi:MAG TPA: hypothetical protein DCE42_30330 [Myxococcales bacterium]|nr:hypothetical protein [Myxococcales bacterium]
MATVSGILIEGLLKSAASRGCSREALCRAMGWDIDSLQGEQLAQRFPIEDFGRLWLQVVEQSGDPSIAYKIGEDISVGEMDILGYVMLSSPTLQDALHYLLRAKRILIDDHLMFVPDGDELAILYLIAEPTLPGGRYVHEHACAALIRTCQWLTRTDILPTRIWTTYHAFPAHEDFAETFGVRITTGQRWNACYYRVEDLTLPLVGANENIHALHVEALEKQLEQLLTPVRWSMQVKSKLEDAFLKAETPQLSWVANALGCSERSLQR